MGPLPKQRHSRSRRNKRRSQDSLSMKQLAQCSNCGAYHVAHHVCPSCGSYRGETVMEVDQEK